MPSLIDIRRRVRAVKSTQQITKAMKMVSASKLRRAQERVVNARPFAQKMLSVLNSLAARVDPSAHPLLAAPGGGERGAHAAHRHHRRQGALRQLQHQRRSRPPAQFATRDDGARRWRWAWSAARAATSSAAAASTSATRTSACSAPLKLSHAQAIAARAIEEFTAGRVSSVYLVYNEFKSVMTQRVVVERLLPIAKLEEAPGAEPRRRLSLRARRRRSIIGELLPKHVESQIYRALLESAAAEHAARMTAMDAATRNASDMIEALTLYMNKVRQAAITREIIEVVSGAQAQ